SRHGSGLARLYRFDLLDLHPRRGRLSTSRVLAVCFEEKRIPRLLRGTIDTIDPVAHGAPFGRSGRSRRYCRGCRTRTMGGLSEELSSEQLLDVLHVGHGEHPVSEVGSPLPFPAPEVAEDQVSHTLDARRVDPLHLLQVVGSVALEVAAVLVPRAAVD